jgi:cytochrome c-type biogenesis protein CcmH
MPSPLSTTKQVVSCLLILAMVTVCVRSYAIDTQPAFSDPSIQARYESITRELRCLVCQNETIADSNAPLAGDLRREVREMVAAGKTNDEIREFMLARYGDFVLYRPRVTPVTLLLWAAPVLFLLLGAFIGIRYIRRHAGESDPDRPESRAS